MIQQNTHFRVICMIAFQPLFVGSPTIRMRRLLTKDQTIDARQHMVWSKMQAAGEQILSLLQSALKQADVAQTIQTLFLLWIFAQGKRVFIRRFGPAPLAHQKARIGRSEFQYERRPMNGFLEIGITAGSVISFLLPGHGQTEGRPSTGIVQRRFLQERIERKASADPDDPIEICPQILQMYALWQKAIGSTEQGFGRVEQYQLLIEALVLLQIRPDPALPRGLWVVDRIESVLHCTGAFRHRVGNTNVMVVHADMGNIGTSLERHVASTAIIAIFSAEAQLLCAALFF